MKPNKKLAQKSEISNKIYVKIYVFNWHFYIFNIHKIKIKSLKRSFL